jgi:hypothetical protein
MPCGREAVDVADFGDDQHRGVATDAADLGQHLDAIVGFGQLVDLAGGGFDLAVKVAELGSVPGRVVHHADRPVLVVRTKRSS